MKTLSSLSSTQSIKFVFTDIDDTLTLDGQLKANAYTALWNLAQSGIKIIPITGRPAGWCEMIARFWPVAGVIGENGAFYFAYKDGKMKRHFVYDANVRKENRQKLDQIQKEVLKEIPGAALASDQFCRLFDLAIDFCEDVPVLENNQIKRIVDIFQSHGAQAKVSSIHVNGWFGNYDKLSMCKIFCEQEFHRPLEEMNEQCVFVGDSPNDEPMFAYFKNSIGVANINAFKDQLHHPPSYVTNQNGGDGFVEVVNSLVKPSQSD